MKEDLRDLLNKVIEAGKPGYLHIGKGLLCRKITYTGKKLTFPEFSDFRWFPTSEILHRSLTDSTRGGLIKSWGSGDRNILKWLPSLQGFHSEELKKIKRDIICKELIHTFYYCDDGFLFERIPQATSQPLQDETDGILAETLIETLDSIQSDITRSRSIFPAFDELLIRSNSINSEEASSETWLQQQVLNMVDGFREIKQLIEDSPFAPHETWNILSLAAKSGSILKQRFPEFSGLQPRSLNNQERERLQSQLDQAIPMAASPVSLLEIQAEIHLSNNNQSLYQETQLEIVTAYQRSHKASQAIETLDQIIQSKPDNHKLNELRQSLVIKFAKDHLANDDLDQGRRWLREAIDSSDDDQLRLDLIASYKNPSDQIREGTRIATKMYRGGLNRRALRLMDSLEALHPENEEMQQLRLEFLIDHGEVEASEEALTRMAARLAREGRVNRARKVARSLSLMRNGKTEKKSTWFSTLRPFIPRFIILIFFASIISAVVTAESKLQKLIASATTLPPTDWRDNARPWLLLLPDGPWKSGLNSAVELVKDRELDLAQDYASRTRNLLEEAHKNRRLGFTKRAEENLKLAEEYGAFKEVRKLRNSWSQEDLAALNLKKRAIQARAQGDLEECHRIQWELIQRFPANDASLDLLFPIMIDSDPGTMIRSSGKSQSVPAMIDAHPYKPFQLQLIKDGRITDFVLTADGPPHRRLPAP